MRKSRLDRLIERNDEKKTVNYLVMGRASERLRQCESGQRREKGFQWGTLSKILVPICCIVIILVGVVVFRHSPSNDSYLPPELEVPGNEKHFESLEGSQRLAESIIDYNREKGLLLKYFDFIDAEERCIVYEDEENEKNKDVLFRQRIVLLATLEQIDMYIELQDNYIFDCLDMFVDLNSEIELAGVLVKYNTFFDEEQVLYCTRTSLEIDGFTYKIEFLLENEEQWITYLSQIL